MIALALAVSARQPIDSENNVQNLRHPRKRRLGRAAAGGVRPSSRLPFEEWFLSEGLLDLAAAPPSGVFYNRMSASSHTARTTAMRPRYTGRRPGLAGIASAARRQRQPRTAARGQARSRSTRRSRRYGIRTPRTIAAVGRAHLIDAARQMSGPFITKHNRAGKGLGVHLFQRPPRSRLTSPAPAFEDSVDGVTLIQEYIQRARAVHHAGRVRRWRVPVRGARRHVARLRALPGRRLPGWRCILPGRRRRECRSSVPARSRRASASSKDFRHPIVDALPANSSPTTASASPASSSSPIVPARSMHLRRQYEQHKLQRRCRGGGRNLRHARHRRVPGQRIAAATHRRGVERAGRRLSRLQRRHLPGCAESTLE